MGGILGAVHTTSLPPSPPSSSSIIIRGGDHPQRRLARHHALRHANVRAPKQKLTIQIANVDGIEVDDLDVTESAQREIFEKFATDSAGSHDEDAAG